MTARAGGVTPGTINAFRSASGSARLIGSGVPGAYVGMSTIGFLQVSGPGAISGTATLLGAYSGALWVVLLTQDRALPVALKQVLAGGAYTFNNLPAGKYAVVVVDTAGNYRSKVIHTTIYPSIGFTSASYAAYSLAVGDAMPYALAATGGSGTYTYTLDSGTLPAGITLNTNGTFSGTATGSSASYSGMFKVTDSASNTATQAFSLTVGDVYFANVVSLLHFDASTTADQIPARAWGTSGTLTISTSQYKYGGGALQIAPASGARLTHAASSDFDMGTGDFTEEAWLYNNAGMTGGCPLTNNQATSNKFLALYLDTDTSGRVIIAGANQITGIVLPSATWYHYALVRIGGVLKAYVNGVQSGTTGSYAGNIGGNDAITVGNSGVHTGFNGFLDDRRVTKGAGRYSGSFTPPPGPFANS